MMTVSMTGLGEMLGNELAIPANTPWSKRAAHFCKARKVMQEK